MTEPLKLDGVLFGQATEGKEALTPAEGSIPPEIAGVFYLNGPANFRNGDFTYNHWLDGDGLIRAVRFENGKADLTTRFVRSKKFTDEEAAGKPVYRAFGTAFEGDQLRRRMALESPVNVSIWPFGGRLLAFAEQALPWELSPDTLETVGECDFDGKLLGITPFSAHPKILGGRLCNFGLQYLMATTRLRYWEFDENFECQLERDLDPGLPYSVHDFTVSENFASFYLSPYLLDIKKFVREGKSIHDSLDWRPEEENVLIILPRTADGEPIRIPLGLRGYCLHLIQSVEDGDRLTIDLFETEEPLYPQYLPLPSLFDTVKPCAFTRINVDTKTGKLLDIVTAPQPTHLDFPALLETSDGRGDNFVWTLAMPVEPAGQSKYYDQILRFDWSLGEVVDSYQASSSCYLSGEPSTVPGNGDGTTDYLIVPMWNAAENQSSYLIFDAFDLGAGPIARLPSASPSHLGFHSTFTPRF